MSSSPEPLKRGPAVHRVRPVGHRQDDAGRAAGAAACRISACRGRTRRGRPGRASRTGLTIISSAASASRRWRAAASSSSGPTCSATTTGPAPPTPKRCWPNGEDVVLVIDVQGARQVRSRGIETVGIFVLPPSARASWSSGCAAAARTARSRFGGASTQRAARSASLRSYEYVVVNDELDGGRRAAAVDRAGRAGAREGDAADGRKHHRDISEAADVIDGHLQIRSVQGASWKEHRRKTGSSSSSSRASARGSCWRAPCRARRGEKKIDDRAARSPAPQGRQDRESE